MKRFMMILLALALLTSCKEKPDTVHLYGQLSDMGADHVVMKYDGALSMVDRSRDVVIDIDDNGNFDIVFELEEPGYYSITRNTLYLTPGDEMKVFINQSNLEAVFEGTGADVNTYMKKRLFPKGGSFLESGGNVGPDLETTRTTINRLAEERKAELAALETASSRFRELETARINADIVNSYFLYPVYASRDNNPGTRSLNRDAVASALTGEINSLIKSFSDDRYLDVAVVRDVMSYSGSQDMQRYFDGVAVSPFRKELYEVAGYIRDLNREANPEKAENYRKLAEGISDPGIRRGLITAIDNASVLFTGRPAIDIEMETPEGKRVMLSELKGKVLYLDFWATWCGPCLKEAPEFNRLAAEYEGRGIDFIQISTDTNKGSWKRYLETNNPALVQFVSTDKKLKDRWEINYIPRFILIDRDFNIIEAYAPMPSDDEVRSILDRALE